MAGKEPVSFDDIIQADRQRRKHEALANEILGKGGKSGASGSGFGGKKPPTGPSLASRIGVVKRSASATFKPKPSGNNSLAPPRPSVPTRPASANRRRPNEDRIVSALLPESGQASVRNRGISIKGTAPGPFVVLGSNFAPGTTSADIESAMEPVGGQMLDCRIVSKHPSVMAEMTFTESRGAENVIATFNNQKADGRVLHVRMKAGGASTTPAESTFNPPTGPRDQSNFNGQREQADRERRERKAEPQIQDGSYGFDDRRAQPQRRPQQNDNSRDTRRSYGGRGAGSRDGEGQNGLYSDEMMIDEPSRGPQGRRRGRR
ncbi:hypothetical protein FQN54_002858 [Arachnomyces sp. PD_36]|nr:hypothetical protein FQN54_002858 [Arachnomyces sp. PD_36]